MMSLKDTPENALYHELAQWKHSNNSLGKKDHSNSLDDQISLVSILKKYFFLQNIFCQLSIIRNMCN